MGLRVLLLLCGVVAAYKCVWECPPACPISCVAVKITEGPCVAHGCVPQVAAACFVISEGPVHSADNEGACPEGVQVATKHDRPECIPCTMKCQNNTYIRRCEPLSGCNPCVLQCEQPVCQRLGSTIISMDTADGPVSVGTVVASVIGGLLAVSFVVLAVVAYWGKNRLSASGGIGANWYGTPVVPGEKTPLLK